MWKETNISDHITKDGYEIRTKQWQKIMNKADHGATITFTLGKSVTYNVSLTGEFI